MTDINPSTNSDFFGRDGFVPFIGQVEDVDDPKRSGRVKVRCVGWHPKQKIGEGGLKTEDLPWARVGMPTTYAQQSRIGGKHGLLPGVWVMGFFMDGDDAQHPFVLTTFNFTAKGSDTDYRKLPDGDSKKLSDADQGFMKAEVGGEQQPNIATRTKDETNQRGYSTGEDPSGDVTADESFGHCIQEATRESAASSRRQKEPFRMGDKGNAESQIYGVAMADGLCGTTAHARDDIKRKMTETIPSAQSRFIYNDAVWNRFTGEFMDLNGIYSQLALYISQLLKQPAQSSKSQQEEQNRKSKAAKLNAKHDRDGVDRVQEDEDTTDEADLMHALFAEGLIDQLFSLIMQILRNLNNSGESTGSDSNRQDTGVTSDTRIRNSDAICLTDNVLDNVNTLVEIAIETAVAASSAMGSDKSLLDDVNAIASILGSLMSVMNFPLTQKYAKFTDLFNSAGSRSMDPKNKEEGCNDARTYLTNLGSIASAMGIGDGGGITGTGFGAEDEFFGLSNVGFGGYPGEGTHLTITEACGDSNLELVPDPGYDNDGTGPGGGGGDNSGGIGTGPGTPGNGGGIGGGDGDGDGGGGAPGDGTGGGGDGGGTIPGGPGTGPGTPGGPPGSGGGDIGGGGDPTTPGWGVGGPGEFPTIPVEGGDGSLVPGQSGAGAYGDSLGSITDSRGFDKIAVPRGRSAAVIAVGLPSTDPVSSKNFIEGKANTIVVREPGQFYYYYNTTDPKNTFPSIYIPYYSGSAIPVVDKRSGELVAILTDSDRFGAYPRPKVSVIPDDSAVGIASDDPTYDIRLGGFYIENSGFVYEDPEITIVDKDNGTSNYAEVKAVVSEGRIVNVEIINNGTNFRRIPEVVIKDKSGYNAILRPIMLVVPQVRNPKVIVPVESIQCPSKNQANLL